MVSVDLIYGRNVCELSVVQYPTELLSSRRGRITFRLLEKSSGGIGRTVCRKPEIVMAHLLSPGERRCAITVSGFWQTFQPIPPLDFSQRWNVILPLLEERAGVRTDEK